MKVKETQATTANPANVAKKIALSTEQQKTKQLALRLTLKDHLDPKLLIRSFHSTDILVYPDLPRGRCHSQPKDRSKQSTFMH
jgi:hypothetical protein